MDDIITYSAARQNLKALMDRVTDNHEIVAITRGNRPPVIMISLEDFKGYGETAYLLKEEGNRAALRRGIDDVAKGRILSRTVDELDALVNES